MRLGSTLKTGSLSRESEWDDGLLTYLCGRKETNAGVIPGNSGKAAVLWDSKIWSFFDPYFRSNYYITTFSVLDTNATVPYRVPTTPSGEGRSGEAWLNRRLNWTRLQPLTARMTR